MDRRCAYSYPLLILLVGLLAYANSFSVPFLFDDTHNILNNPALRAPWQLLSDCLNPLSPNRRACGFLIFALNYRLGGADVTGYHLVNLLIHLAASLLVYGITFQTLKIVEKTPDNRDENRAYRDAALLAGLLFVAHPVQTQAVTYIVQRFTSLATCFYLLALFGYIRARMAWIASKPGFRLRCAGFYLLTMAATLLAMKSKEIALTLPLAILCYEALFFTGAWRRRLLFLLPILATVCLIPLAALNSATPGGSLIRSLDQQTRALSVLPRSDYLITQLRVLVTYLRLMILPVNQQVDYDYPLFTSLLAPQALAALALLCGLLGLGFWLVRCSRHSGRPELRLVAFGIFWFFLTVLVESGLVTIADVIFEHRCYLPAAGFCMAFAVALVALCRNRQRLLFVGLALVVSLAVATGLRNRVWQSEIGLWQDNLAKAPGKTRVLASLGRACERAGQREQALIYYSRAIALNNGQPVSRNNRGNLYAAMGRLDLALADFNAALALDPGFTEAYVNRGTVLMETGQPEAAIRDFDTALRLRPDDAEIYNNRGNAYDALGRYDRALADYDLALRINPGLAIVARNRELTRGKMPRRTP